MYENFLKFFQNRVINFDIRQKNIDAETNNFIKDIAILRLTYEAIIDFNYHNSSLIQTLPKHD
jgi:hypothetical protein